MMVVIDNYDSFTFNLVQYLMAMDVDVRVFRNDAITVDEVVAMAPDQVLVSPGPCTPSEAGISVPLIQAVSGKVPVLGVCLGHQSLVAAFGGKIVGAQRLMHGKVSRIDHDGKGLFDKVKSPMTAVRYHSLAAEADTLPGCFEVSARAEDGEIMAVRHREHLSVGVQFHPESILTPSGKRLLGNFLKIGALLDRNQE
jgi:anthranilate synthase/aminodeoxychorismate synthase-like glutamine amidotransferase